MADSFLDRTGEQAPVIKGMPGTRELGPSDSSDTGSDIVGGAGLADDAGMGLPTGTTSDIDAGHARGTAGPDVGDANLDSDSDAGGTGERATVGRDSTVEDGSDISVDRIVSADEIGITYTEYPEFGDETDEVESEPDTTDRSQKKREL